MFERYSEKVDFIFIYIVEAHAEDEWPLGGFVKVNQHKNLKEREEIARKFKDDKKIKMPMYLDSMDNVFNHLYSPWPERHFLIKSNSEIQKIYLPNNKGYLNLDQLESDLKKLLKKN